MSEIGRYKCVRENEREREGRKGEGTREKM